MEQEETLVTMTSPSPPSPSAERNALTSEDLSSDDKIRLKEDFNTMVGLLQDALKLPSNASPASTICELQLRFRYYDDIIKELSNKAEDHDTLLHAVAELVNTSSDRKVDNVIERLKVTWRRQEKIRVYMRRRLDNAEQQLRCSRALVRKLETKLKNTGIKESQKMQHKLSAASEGRECPPQHCGEISERDEFFLLRKLHTEMKKRCELLEKKLPRMKRSKLGRKRSLEDEEIRNNESTADDVTVANRPFGEIGGHVWENCAVNLKVENGTQTEWLITETESKKDLDEFRRRTKAELAYLQVENDDNKDMICRLRKILASFHESIVISSGCMQVSLTSTVDQAVLASFSKTYIKRLDPSKLVPWGNNMADTAQETVIGKGAFGKVTLMRYLPTNLLVAIKVQEKKDNGLMLSSDDLENMLISRTMKEAIMHYVMSDNSSFPVMHGIVEFGKTIAIVLEFIGNKLPPATYPLCHVLAERRAGLNTLEWIDIAIDVVNGIAALHDKGLLHNDLKKNNILLQHIGDRWRAYIIDFGHGSTIVIPMQFPSFSLQEEGEYMDGLLYQHLAPEIVRDQQPTSVHSDIYSLGVVLRHIAKVSGHHDMMVLAEMCTRSKPYRRPSMPNIELSVLRSKQKAQQ